MALREDQIQRYSRQILLKEVGGRGQSRLLEAVVSVEGQSQALDVAVAALAASGSPIADVHLERTGFLFGASLDSLSPDAVAEPTRRLVGWLGPYSRGATAPVDCFRVGISNGLVVGFPAFRPWSESVLAAEPAEPVTAGSLAALVVQRYVLALDQVPVTLRWFGGRWQRD